MNVQTTGLANVPYIREGHSGEAISEGGGFTAEGSSKNEVAMDWTQQDAPVRKITAWLPMTTEAIEDAPTLRGYIDGRLVYLIDVSEEEAILAGPGTGVTIRGILNHSGLQEATYTADIVAGLGLAVGAVEDHDGAADGIVMRPTDYWTTVTSRHSTQFDGGAAGLGGTALPFTAQSANLPMWGLPVVRSRSCPADTAIVGAFRQAATLFDRMRTTIRVGTQHSTYFVENKVAVVAEERLALAVHRPDLFVSVPLVDPED
jgi:HK97 family phage major capsid protein